MSTEVLSERLRGIPQRPRCCNNHTITTLRYDSHTSVDDNDDDDDDDVSVQKLELQAS